MAKILGSWLIYGKQLIILFGGGIKDSQKSDIKKAQELYQEYKERKKSNKD